MIDWITARVPLRHDFCIDGGYVRRVDEDGEIIYDVICRRVVEGSYSSTVNVRSSHFGLGQRAMPMELALAGVGGDFSDRRTDADNYRFDSIEVDGNLVKFFQGHNIFGTDDLVGLVASFMEWFCVEHDIVIYDDDRKAWWAGDFTLSRVDLTNSFEFPTPDAVDGYIRAAESNGRLAYRGRGLFDPVKGLIFGMGSRRWNVKLYNKGAEFRKHSVKLDYRLDYGCLQSVADKLCRVEILFRGMELKRFGGSVGAYWLDHGRVDALYQSYVDQLQLSGTVLEGVDICDGMSTAVANTYRMFELGIDLRSVLPRTTWYRMRKDLLKFGLDISLEVGDRRKAGTLVSVLEMFHKQRAKVPEWAVGTIHYYQPDWPIPFEGVDDDGCGRARVSFVVEGF